MNGKKVKKKSKSHKARNIIIIFAALAAVLGLLLLARKIKNKDAEGAKIYTVRRERFRNIIEIAGTISAAQEQNLQAAGDGSVVAVYVKEGDAVKKGDVILQIDDISERYNLANHDFEIAQKRVNGSSRELTLMQQQREVLLQKIKDREIIANFDGIIAQLTAKTGDYLEAKDQIGVLIDRSYLKALVEVVETDAPKLEAGQKVFFSFPAYKNGRVEGYVVSFPAVGKVTTRGASIVEVEVRIDNPPPEILPNYSFTGEIEISPPEDLLLVEREAIGYENGASFAERILPNGRKERVPVKVESYGDSFVKVLSPLEEGDKLNALQKASASGTNRNSGRPSQGQNRPPPQGGAPRMF